MPPRRKAAAKAKAASPPPPLDGCKIGISGTIPGLSQATLKSYIEQLGAEALNTVTADATHLITTPAGLKNPSAKVRAAQAQAIPIIYAQWLLDCLSDNARKPESSYLATNAPTAPPATAVTSAVATTTTATNTTTVTVVTTRAARKRIASPPNASSSKQAPSSQPAPKKAKVAKKAAAKPKAAKLVVPVDECCPLINVVVHVDDDGVIWDASLNQTNSQQNNNKFYRIQILHNGSGRYQTWTRWGRVGENGQSNALGNGSLDDATKQFCKKFKDKSGILWADRNADPKPGKYAYIERNYGPDSDSDGDADSHCDTDAGENGAEDTEDLPLPTCSLALPIQNLMELIFNRQYFAATMTDLNYDANKLPLGKLSKSTITRGFQALKDLSALLDDASLAQSVYSIDLPSAIGNLSNLYYSLIPHAFGRNRPPIIGDYIRLKKEVELLESLSDMKDAELLMKVDRAKSSDPVHPADKHFSSLGMKEMTPLDPTSVEFQELANYLVATRGTTHHVTYKIQDIFRIERNGEQDRFSNGIIAEDAHDRRLLWHGSRVTNFAGILSQGLRIAPPEAPVTGYMFGKGIYLADMSSKSANYCCAGISGGTALLLLCEADLGSPLQELTNSSYSAGEDAKKQGLYSTWGKGQTGPLKWKDAGCVHDELAGVKIPDVSSKPGATQVPNACLLYNEFIVYDISQVRLRYLFRVSM